MDHDHSWKTVVIRRRRVATSVGDIRQCSICDALQFQILLESGPVWDYSPMDSKRFLEWLRSK